MDEQARWDVFNQFSLWGDVDRYTKLLARYELFKQIVDKPGDIVEGGVLKGAGVLYWAKLIQIFNPMSRRKVIGFDTFEGYPEDTSRAYDRKTAKAYSKAQIAEPELVATETIMEIAEQQGLADRIQLVKGDAAESVEQYVKEHPGFRVALLNLDFVLYEPTLGAMKALYPRVVPGGMVVLDEYAVPDKGESEAVDEVLKGENVQMQSFPWAKSPTAYFVKSDQVEQ
ncbi:MAG: class I SAM-dependent methyltransferase [Chloroflexi bacterium]|nr:class I SAM-dependent methyltransferase [Chloroflexota bacterium]